MHKLIESGGFELMKVGMWAPAGSHILFKICGQGQKEGQLV